MKAKSKTINEIFLVLVELNVKYPNQGIMRHVVDATEDYKNNLWILNDTELLFALNKYKTELDMNIADDSEVEKIMKDASNLEELLKEEDLFDVNSEENWLH